MAKAFIDTLPRELVTHIKSMCGKRGEEWFDQLPASIRALQEKWSLKVHDPFPGIEYNFVAPATMANGRKAVVKIGPPFERTEIYGEAQFLRVHRGLGAVELIAEDRDARAILIERAVPGDSLVDRFAAEPIASVRAAIDVLASIVLPPPDDMADVDTLDNWFNNFRRYRETDFLSDRAEKAFEIYERLSKQPGRTFYLHGDFHLGNIVTSDRAPFLAIDPKGIVGHIGYDIAVFLINLHRWRRDDRNVAELINEAIQLFASAFELTERQVREWAYATMVIGGWWNFEDMPELYDSSLAMPDIWDL
jgi:streptomycin 6-kinase